MINITGLDKAEVLKALYDNVKTQGMGFSQYDPKPMDIEDARKMIKGGRLYFDYIKGRVMKVDLKDNDTFNEWLYDRDNGTGSAQTVIDKLRQDIIEEFKM